MASIPRSIPLSNGHAMADLTGYEDAETLAWDRACLTASDRLTATPSSPLAIAEQTRLAKGLDLARTGAVTPTGEDTAEVLGTGGIYSVWLSPFGCSCKDWHVRHLPCKHLIAALIHAEAMDASCVAPWEPETPLSAPLPGAQPPVAARLLVCPEAEFSLTLDIALCGRTGRLTVRGQTFEAFSRNVKLVKGLFEVDVVQSAPTADEPLRPDEHVCPYHGTAKESTKAKGTLYCPSRMADQSYCKWTWSDAPAAGAGK